MTHRRAVPTSARLQDAGPDFFSICSQPVRSAPTCYFRRCGRRGAHIRIADDQGRGRGGRHGQSRRRPPCAPRRFADLLLSVIRRVQRGHTTFVVWQVGDISSDRERDGWTLTAVGAPVWASENDFRAMMRIVETPDPGEDGVALPRSTVDALAQLIPCVALTFNLVDVQRQRHYMCQGGDHDEQYDESAEQRFEEIFWMHYPDSYCCYPERTGDYSSVMMSTDHCSMLEYRRTPMYIDYLKPLGVDREIMLTIPDGGSRQLRLIIFRGRTDPDFTERDRALLMLLRPHLRAAHLEVLRRRSGIPSLTERQWELLRLVEQGLGNKQIARRLNVSENTVRKHLENIFGRLEVSSRTAAVARAFPARPVL